MASSKPTFMQVDSGSDGPVFLAAVQGGGLWLEQGFLP